MPFAKASSQELEQQPRERRADGNQLAAGRVGVCEDGAAILGKTTAHTMQEGRFEVCLDRASPVSLADFGAMPRIAGQRGWLPRAPGAPCQRCAAASLERRGTAGTHQGRARRNPWCLRLAAHPAGAGGA